MVVSFLIAVVVVGCASAQGNIDERGGEESAAETNEETTTPKGETDRLPGLRKKSS